MKTTLPFICLLSLLFILPTAPATGQWVQTNGPYGGPVADLLAHGDTLLAGTYGGIFRSVNAGQNWVPTFDEPVGQLVRVGSTLIATSWNGVFHSADQGETWTLINTDLNNFTIVHLLANGPELFAGTTNFGVYRSSDMGAHWTPVNNNLPNEQIRAFALFQSTLYVATPAGVFRSSDNGNTWLPGNTGLPNNDVYDFAAVGPTLFACHSTGISYLDGSTWTQLNAIPGQIYSLLSDGSSLLANSGGKVFRLDGTDWAPVGAGLPQQLYLYTNAYAVSGAYLYAGTSRGVYRTADAGNTWLPLQQGLANTSVTSLAVYPGGVLAGSVINGAFRSANHGDDWTPMDNSLQDANDVCFFTSGDHLFAVLSFGGLLISSDGGNTWSDAAQISGAAAFVEVGDQLFAGAYDGIFRSSDLGATWESALTGAPLIRCVALAIQDSTLFAGTNLGVFRSHDAGQSWQPCAYFYGEKTIASLLVCGDFLFVGTYDGVYRTQDKGVTWEQVNAFLPFSPDVLALAAHGQHLYVQCGNQSIYHSSDYGIVWTNIYDSPDHDLGAIAVDGEYLYAGTYTTGVWRRPLSEVSAAENPGASPYAGVRCAPNPFRAATDITFTLEDAAPVRLCLFDAHGREVAVLVDQTLPAGTHTRRWEAAGVPAGLYVYRLRAGRREDAGKVVVIR